MVDRAALEMQCTARYRGFESLPLRQLDISLRSRARARAWDRARRAGGMRTLTHATNRASDRDQNEGQRELVAESQLGHEDGTD